MTFSRVGICSVKSGGAGSLPALYSGYSSCLNVGPLESIASIICDGLTSLINLNSIDKNPWTIVVVIPVDVDIGCLE